MAGLPVPRIGLVSDSPLHLFALQAALKDAAYDIVLVCAPAKLNAELLRRAAADVWVASLSQDADSSAIVSLLLDHLEVPILLDDNSGERATEAGLAAWAARLTGKLQQLGIARGEAPDAEVLPCNPVIAGAAAKLSRFGGARHVWVLGASLGGPEAVTEFLHALPANLPLCLVYAQHIEPNFSGLLAEVMARNTDFDTAVLNPGSVLSHGRLGVVPVETELRFRPLGKMEATGTTWPGPYAPSIDQVISDVAGLYGDCSGAIIFSGMGEDGAASCERVQGRGGSIWAQRPDTCICDSMPEAAIDTGLVEYQASPTELAQALAQRYACSPSSPSYPSYSHVQDQL